MAIINLNLNLELDCSSQKSFWNKNCFKTSSFEKLKSFISWTDLQREASKWTWQFTFTPHCKGLTAAELPNCAKRVLFMRAGNFGAQSYCQRCQMPFPQEPVSISLSAPRTKQICVFDFQELLLWQSINTSPTDKIIGRIMECIGIRAVMHINHKSIQCSKAFIPLCLC